MRTGTAVVPISLEINQCVSCGPSEVMVRNMTWQGKITVRLTPGARHVWMIEASMDPEVNEKVGI
jgi:hypothetical protein